MKAFRLFVALLLGLLVTVRGARADEPSAPPAVSATASAPAAPLPVEPDADTRRARAAALHEEGVALYQQRDVRRALERFEAAFALFPALKHAENAAFCREKLDEPVEALTLYDDILERFAAELLPEHHARIEARRAELRARVAELFVDANGPATIVIDGRTRGELPLTRPLYVEPGNHRLRVAREGYVTFEVTIEVEAGKRLTIGTRLAPLLDQGRVRVEEPTGAALRVFVNGAMVGTTPWEGPLAPGKYAVWTLGEGVGSAPEPVIVLRGQTALVRVAARPLGSRVRVDVEPPDAELSLGDASLGPGAWEGRLPAGRYRLSAHASGHESVRRELVVPPGEGSLEQVVNLPAERAPTPSEPWLPGAPWLGTSLGLAATADLGAYAEAACPDRCSDDAPVLGVAALARLGWRFPSELGVELGAGFLSLATSVRTTHDAAFTAALRPYVARYDLEHALALRGPVVSLGASQSLELGSELRARLALDLGLFFAHAEDRLTGTIRGDGRVLDAWVSGAGTGLDEVMPYAAPALELALRRGPLELGLSVGAWVFAGNDSAYDDVELGPRAVDAAGAPTCTLATPNPGCAPGQRIARGAAHGAFVAWVPALSARYSFGAP